MGGPHEDFNGGDDEVTQSMWIALLALSAQDASDEVVPPPSDTVLVAPVEAPAPAIAPTPAPTPAPIPTAPKPELLYRPIDTAEDYVSPEQEATAFAWWLDRDDEARGRFAAFQAFLVSRGVGSVVPPWQLTRTASAWRNCGAAAMEVPPDYMWEGLARTLAFVRDEVIPVTGEVEAVSVYRNPHLNSCAGGSARSAHRAGLAIDMVPRWPFAREELMRRLCFAHAKGGQWGEVGLGFYVGLRFHIDTAGYRSWGLDPGVGAACQRALALREAARAAE